MDSQSSLKRSRILLGPWTASMLRRSSLKQQPTPSAVKPCCLSGLFLFKTIYTVIIMKLLKS